MTQNKPWVYPDTYDPVDPARSTGKGDEAIRATFRWDEARVCRHPSFDLHEVWWVAIPRGEIQRRIESGTASSEDFPLAEMNRINAMTFQNKEEAESAAVAFNARYLGATS